MTTILNTVLDQMRYFNKYEYPAKKWNKVYPYSEVDNSVVNFSEINTDDIYAYEEGDDFHISFSDDNYCYTVVIRKQYVS